MIRRSLAFVFIAFALGLPLHAQTSSPGSGAKGEGRVFSMFFEGDGGYLGVQTEEVTKDNFSKFGLREVRGVAVEKVIEGSPAEKAGLQAGDVIVRFNGEELTSVRKLTRMLGEVSPDHQAKLTVIRGGGEREIAATLGKRPIPKFEEGSFGMNLPRAERIPFPPSADMPPLPPMRGTPGTPGEPFGFRWGTSGRRIGISVTTLTTQLSEHYGVPGGVLINEVRINSAAAKAGLKAGDVIVEVDGKELKSEGELIRAISEKREGDLSLTILRERNRQTIRVTPEEAKDGFNSFYIVPTPRSVETRAPSFWDGARFPRLFPNGLFPALRF